MIIEIKSGSLRSEFSKNLSLTLMCSLTILFSYGQNFSYPSIRKQGNFIKEFVPGDWKILDSAKGDLNRDNIEDAVVVLQHSDSVLFVKTENIEDTVITQPRLLLILFKNSSDNNYNLIEQNNSFILNHESSAMDDPFQGIKINKGILQIDFQLFYNMGSWSITTASYKFRFNNNEFFLIGADYSSIHRASLDFEDYNYNFLTKKRSVTKGNESNGSKKTTWKTLDINALKSFKTFKTPFTWEVEQDVYL
jgi:hypothetical protein